MNIKQAFLALDVLAASDITGHLIGKHGIGKSSIIKQYAKLRGYTYVEVRVGLMADAGDLVGIQEFIKCETTGNALSTKHVLPDWFMEGVSAIGEAAKSGKKVLIFLDEINRGHKDLLQAVFELVLDFSLKGVKLAPGSMVVAASNPPTDDYAVLDFSDAAFQDRFCHIKLEPTTEEFFQYAKASGMDESLYEFLQSYPQMIETEGKPFNLDFVTPSRRSHFRADQIIKTCEKLGHPEVELELLFGILGEKAALAYKSFKANHVKSIKAIDVFENYTTSKAVRDSVINAVSKNRSDVLGTLNEELLENIKKLEGLTTLQADNLAALVSDLPVEHAYAFALKVTSQEYTRSITKIDGKSPGLYAHKEFVDRIKYIRSEKDKIKNATEEVADESTTTSKTSKKKK